MASENEQEDEAPHQTGDRDYGRVSDYLEVVVPLTLPPTTEQAEFSSASTRHLPPRGVMLSRLVPSDEPFHALQHDGQSQRVGNPIIS